MNHGPNTPAAAPPTPQRASWRAHVQIARLDHWIKNLFVIPGAVAALGLHRPALDAGLAGRLLLGMICVGVVASGNYVLNEILDAPCDRAHPRKCRRPVPSGRVHVPLAYAQWLALGALGVGLGLWVSTGLALVLLGFGAMGCVYNIPPLRSKDVPYLDVLSEAVNNPLRMLAGWFMVDPHQIIPTTLLCGYWMVGAYLMALKRFAEYHEIGDKDRATQYRKCFAFYNGPRLLGSVTFYGSAAMLFFGAFIMRYRLELILSFPLVALVMAIYFQLAFQPHSPVQAPEALWRQPLLMGAVAACATVMTLLMFIDVPVLHAWLVPTAPVQAPEPR
jgi:decaprenyl-phosphate phosphoribosyltransferase